MRALPERALASATALGLTSLLLLGSACGRSVAEPEGSPAGASAVPDVTEVARVAGPGATPQGTEPQPLSSSALAHITPQRLRAHVEHLADDRLRGRPTPSPQLDEAADYVLGQLRAQSLRAPELAPDHVQRFECGGPDHPGLASNVLALLPGRDPELAAQTVMVTAHYDHIGERAFGEDRIFNGANDDASGTAAMLAIAEALAASPSPPRRSVLFVAFCGEERGLRGSSHYAQHPVRPLEQVVAHVNLEMLGRPALPGSHPEIRPGSQVAWLPGMMRSELGQWLIDANPRGEVVFLDGFAIGEEEGAAFNRSDNFPLARQGVVAHTVAAGTIDALYHSPDDEADRLDYDRMAVIVQAVARGVWRLSEHEAKPGWFDPPQ